MYTAVELRRTRSTVENFRKTRSKRGPLFVGLVAVIGASLLSVHATSAGSPRQVRSFLIFYELELSSPALAVVDGEILSALKNFPFQIELYRKYLETTLFPNPTKQQELREGYLHKHAFKDTPVVFGGTSELSDHSNLSLSFAGVWFEQDAAGGKKPPDISLARGANLFDWRALKRWGLKEAAFPPVSILLNAAPTVWESYKGYIIGGIALILLETLLIVGLLWQRRRRREVETELVISSDRLRLAVEAGKSVGWDWDARTGITRWFGDLHTMFGIEADTYSGQHEDFERTVYPEDWEGVQQAIADARQSRKPYTAEFRAVRTDGTVRWVTAKGQFYYTNEGDPARMLGMSVDITERRKAEEALRESEQRFSLVANTAPVMIWMSGPDKLRNYFNRPWLDFTGRPQEADLGNGWSEGVHPEDLGDCMHTYNRAFDLRESFKMQYRLRRHDGEYRWVLDMGVPRLNPDGSFVGFIGSCLDVTEAKLAEESLANMGRRLIEAHEEERTWIARELHDDINQRIALLSVELEQWGQHFPGSEADVRNHMSHLRQRLFDLGRDIQALSHRLHFSKLDYLGIASAANSFCKELSEQQKVEIDFTHAAIPGSLPKEVSLCLFRVLQEALQNAAKHSRVRHFNVDLLGTPEEIQLTVTDLGVGFDPQDAINRRGLGLISMRERLQLVSGELSIKSEPGRGTTVLARVPFVAKRDSARAAG